MALVPGTDMDPVDGGASVRLSFAASQEVLAEALERIVAFQGHYSRFVDMAHG